ncbi:alpha/beta hydrolase [Kurthia sp. FSL E2-0154]|uniref:alpha/beta hydrolase n=1 Tax=Kurthia sp. FSL E2-0154 TaxID=2921358 RepID=UPI0030FA8025
MGKLNKKIFSPLFVLLLLVISVGVFSMRADYTSAELFDAKHEFSYGEQANQDLKIYQKGLKKGEKTPVVLYIHGGGWYAGDKANVGKKPGYFNKKGYTFISMNYRLSPVGNYEDQASDVAAAMKWIVDHADQYHLDANQITLMGHSAGGHLVSLVALDPRYLKEVGLPLHTICGVINIEGPLDMSDFIKEVPKYKSVYGKNPNVWKAASPSTYLGQQAVPPMLIISREDAATTKFVKAAKKLGEPVDLLTTHELSHSDLTGLIGTNENAEAIQVTNAVTKFLQANQPNTFK